MGKEKKSAGRRRSDLMTRRNRTGYVFIAPFLVGFAAFMLIPLIQSFIFSFNDIKIVENGYTLVPKGLYNYQYILTIDTDFRQRIVNSFIMTLRDTIVVVPFSFFSALILSKEFHGRTFARAIFFLPVIVSTGVLATMDSNSVISMMMDRDTASAANSMQQTFSASGLITTLFADSLPTEMVDFISTATAGIYDIIIKSGLQIIIFIGGLNTISPSLFESSNIVRAVHPAQRGVHHHRLFHQPEQSADSQNPQRPDGAEKFRRRVQRGLGVLHRDIRGAGHRVRRAAEEGVLS